MEVRKVTMDMNETGEQVDKYIMDEGMLHFEGMADQAHWELIMWQYIREAEEALSRIRDMMMEGKA